ncbi:hypothetical protein NHL50_04470 [Acidimicrobiia bacterium EGI L10123]|uniref:hypothetical protein n=1 Tax=Salinilacustrithrix flava TaxID=2957203 RepID=UPI003D7C28C6|nr:hypothetical protein [Acidimicrobiia bacterium EGI L10123]
MERDALADVWLDDDWWDAPAGGAADAAMVDARRAIRSLEASAGALAQDRTQQIHLGKAVGVVLVLVTVVTLSQLVQAAFQDLGQVL